MTDSFEKWIKGMEEMQYEDWLSESATDAQEEKALNIRQPLNEDELKELEREQESLPESVKQPVEPIVSGQKEIEEPDYNVEGYSQRYNIEAPTLPKRRYNIEGIPEPQQITNRAEILGEETPVLVESRTPIIITPLKEQAPRKIPQTGHAPQLSNKSYQAPQKQGFFSRLIGRLRRKR